MLSPLARARPASHSGSRPDARSPSGPPATAAGRADTRPGFEDDRLVAGQLPVVPARRDLPQRDLGVLVREREPRSSGAMGPRTVWTWAMARDATPSRPWTTSTTPATGGDTVCGRLSPMSDAPGPRHPPRSGQWWARARRVQPVYTWEWGNEATRRPGCRGSASSCSSSAVCCSAQQLFPALRDLGSVVVLAIGLAFLVQWAITRGSGSLYLGAIITALAAPGVLNASASTRPG